MCHGTLNVDAKGKPWNWAGKQGSVSCGWIGSSLTNSAGRLHGGHSVQGLLLLLSVLVPASVAAVVVVMVVSSLLTLALARPGRRLGHLGPLQVVRPQPVLVLVLLRQRGCRASDGTEVNNGLRGRRRTGDVRRRGQREAGWVTFKQSVAADQRVHPRHTKRAQKPCGRQPFTLTSTDTSSSSHRCKGRFRRMNIDLKYSLLQTFTEFVNKLKSERTNKEEVGCGLGPFVSPQQTLH